MSGFRRVSLVEGGGRVLASGYLGAYVFPVQGRQRLLSVAATLWPPASGPAAGSSEER